MKKIITVLSLAFILLFNTCTVFAADIDDPNYDLLKSDKYTKFTFIKSPKLTLTTAKLKKVSHKPNPNENLNKIKHYEYVLSVRENPDNIRSSVTIKIKDAKKIKVTPYLYSACTIKKVNKNTFTVSDIKLTKMGFAPYFTLKIKVYKDNKWTTYYMNFNTTMYGKHSNIPREILKAEALEKFKTEIGEAAYAALTAEELNALDLYYSHHNAYPTKEDWEWIKNYHATYGRWPV